VQAFYLPQTELHEDAHFISSVYLHHRSVYLVANVFVLFSDYVEEYCFYWFIPCAGNEKCLLLCDMWLTYLYLNLNVRPLRVCKCYMRCNSEVWSSYNSYDEGTAFWDLYFGGTLVAFWKNLLPSSSGWKHRPSCENLKVGHLVKKFITFYIIWRWITLYIWIISWSRWPHFHIITSCFLKMFFEYDVMFPMWSVPVRVLQKENWLHLLLLWNLIFCGLLVRVPGCRPRGPGLDSRRCQIFWVVVGLEQGPLSPCEDKWGATWKKVAAPV
jgi:hypothetical protein